MTSENANASANHAQLKGIIPHHKASLLDVITHKLARISLSPIHFPINQYCAFPHPMFRPSSSHFLPIIFYNFPWVFPFFLLLPFFALPSVCSPIFSHTLIIETGPPSANANREEDQRINHGLATTPSTTTEAPQNDNNQNDQPELQPISGNPTQLVLNELNSHFAGLNASKVAKISQQLQRAKQLAHQNGYGKRKFSHDAEVDRQKPVSISSAQPNTSVEMAQLLFEGDILLSEGQIGTLLGQLAASGDSSASSIMAERIPSKRSLSADPDALWSRMPIKFWVHESLELTAIQQIFEAIAYWENNTCIRFEQQELGAPKEEGQDFMEFFKGQGCYSMIGRFGGRQGVSIGAGCERVVGIVEHEIGHVLGLWHEQSRPDAWKYVQVEKAFIMPSYMADFQLRGTDEILTLGLPYDYGSVMHYGPTAFSSDGTSVTLMTKNVLFQSTIGQRDRLAFFDLMSINKAYCADKCGGIPELRHPGYKPPQTLAERRFETQAKCQNGGYPNPGRCQQCICPSGYGGNRCEKEEMAKKANCGGELFVKEGNSWTELKSPNYDGEGYEPGQHCNWIVRSPLGTRIQAEFLGDFSLLCATICLDYVELKLAKDQRLTGARFCCGRRPEGPLISEHNQIAILFRAQLAQDIGFWLRLRATTMPATSQKTGKNGNKKSEESQSSNEGGGGGGGGNEGKKKVHLLPGKDIWASWGPWSACSRPCGGCGIRSRVRSCLSEECPNGKAQEFSACNFQACPVSPNCQKVLYLNRLCHSALSDSPAICSQLASQLAQCNQPSCCPPFYVLNGKCVTDEFDQNGPIGLI